MLKKEFEILELFAKNPWKKAAFKEIQEYSKKTSKSYVYNTIQKFVKQEVLKEEKAGNVVLYSLNIDTEKSSTYAGIVAEHLAWNKNQLPYDVLEQLMKKMPTDFFVMLLTGSYASGKQKKSSDLDMVIICDDSFEPKKIDSELRHFGEISIPPVHLYVFKRKDFLKMLLDKEANYGKEAARNNLVISGGKIYLKLVGEAIKNGFTG